MKTNILSSIAILVLVAVASPVMAQPGNEMPANGMEGNETQKKDVQGQLSGRDFKFVKTATEGGKMELTLGQIATQNAQDPAVRDFGSRMVRDHQAANQELTQIASRKGATVSDTPGMMDQRAINKLQELKGSEFDRAFMKRMVSDHKAAIKEFQKEAENADDGELKAFASKTLPALQEHLRLAQDTQAKLTSSASR